MGHWYDQTGKPTHTIVGKNKKVRDTNVSDARRLNLVPSVTGIIQVIDKPMLTQWKLKQLLAAASSVAPIDSSTESMEEWANAVWQIYKRNTESYSKEGTEIHQLLESAYNTGVVEDRGEIIYPVLDAIHKEFGDLTIQTEVNFAHTLGYGGQIDLVLSGNNRHIIIDFKTKQGKDLSKKLYSDYIIQLAAYRAYFPWESECYNVLISVTDPGEVYIHKYTKEEIDHGFKLFSVLLEYWKLQNKYDAGFKNDVQQ